MWVRRVVRCCRWPTILAGLAFSLLLSCPQTTKAQIAVDTTTTAASPSGSDVSSLTWSHTVGAGSNRLLIVGVSVADASVSVTSVKYGGTSLTFVGAKNDTGNTVRIEMWRLIAPASGTANIVVSLPSQTRLVGGAVSFTGVNQTTPNGSFTSAQGSSSTASVNVASATGEMVIDTVGTPYLGGGSLTVGGGQTRRWNNLTGTGGGEVRGGGSTAPGASTVTMSWGLGIVNSWAIGALAIKPALPDLTITKTHSGNFTQGQVGATYSITVTNSGSANSSGTVTVTDTLPAGLTATAISGTNWTCVLGTLTCTRSNALAAGASYPAITLTVDVASNASASVTNTANVSGGGEIITTNDTANDPTTINQLPDLTITKTHSGNFTQGQVGATYSITVTNSGLANSSGTVTVTDTLPAGLTATAISGTNWTCVLGTLTCTRSNALAAGASYPAITLTVDVANNAPTSVTNTASVSGGGETNTANDTATDATTINAAPPNIGMIKSVSPTGAQVPGTELTYTVVYTNTGGQPASNFIIVDPNTQNVDPLERVFHNLDFKVGSITSSPGTTGLVATFYYSNDGGASWTYSPSSGGGGAPAGYDRSVTNLRWTFAGNLSQSSPNNTGSVSFIARIR